MVTVMQLPMDNGIAKTVGSHRVASSASAILVAAINLQAL